MALILIREGTPGLAALLAAIVTECGHEARVLVAGEENAPRGDLLLLDPLVADALHCVEAFRRFDPSLPVVCVGSDPRDPLAHAIGPTAIVPKPFRVAELVSTVTLALHEAS